MKAISLDLFGKFAFFKANDMNEDNSLYISYDFIHKPAILGMLGAIAGFSGYGGSRRNEPEYYKRLKNIKLAIKPYYFKPLNKVIINFNDSTGFSNKAIMKDAKGKPIKNAKGKTIIGGATRQIREQVLVGNPEIRYTVFLLDDGQLPEVLKNRLFQGETKFPLYFGKNEYCAYFNNVTEYIVNQVEKDKISIDSLVKVAQGISQEPEVDPFKISNNYNFPARLPFGFDQFFYYKKARFEFTNYFFNSKDIESLYTLQNQKDIFNVQFI